MWSHLVELDLPRGKFGSLDVSLCEGSPVILALVFKRLLEEPKFTALLCQ